MKKKIIFKDNEKANWLWSYILHAETILTNRMNFFVASEAVLVATFISIHSDKLYATPLFILGLTISSVWYIVNKRTLLYIGNFTKEFDKIIPEHKFLLQPQYKITSGKILGDFLPKCFIIIWVLLITFLCKDCLTNLIKCCSK